MAMTLTVTSATFTAKDAARPTVVIRGLANFGNPYSVGGHEMTAAIVNAGLLASGLHADCTVSAITDCLPGMAADYATHCTFVVATKKIMGYVAATHAELGAIDVSAAAYNFPVTIWATKA
jgi:hypothetical protein